MTENLHDGLKEELERVKIIYGHVKDDPSPCLMFMQATLKSAIEIGEKTLASGGPVDMLNAYELLKDIEG